MARIAGVDLPRNKNLNIALTYIHGVGKKTSEKIIETLKLSPTLKTDQMDEAIVAKIRDYLERNLAVEGELRRVEDPDGLQQPPG